MKNFVQKYNTAAGWFFTIADVFNVLFFLISLVVWMWFLWQSNLSDFQWGDLWPAFNGMYKEFSFKVSCIFLILFNGLISFKQMFDRFFFTFVAFHRWKTTGEVAHKMFRKK